MKKYFNFLALVCISLWAVSCANSAHYDSSEGEDVEREIEEDVPNYYQNVSAIDESIEEDHVQTLGVEECAVAEEGLEEEDVPIDQNANAVGE